MARNPYIPVFCDIIESSIWDEPAPVFKAWIYLLAKMDSDGHVKVVRPKALARGAGITEDEARMAIDTLSSADPESGNPEFEGRRIIPDGQGWLVVSAQRYRDKARAESERARKARHIAKKRARAADSLTELENEPDTTNNLYENEPDSLTELETDDFGRTFKNGFPA